MILFWSLQSGVGRSTRGGIKGEEVGPMLEPVQRVERHEAEEKERRRKKKVKVEMEVEGIDTAPTALEDLQGAQIIERQRRKERKKGAAMSSALDPILELAVRCGSRRKEHKRREIKAEEVAVMDHTLEPVETVESHEATSCREPLEKEERKRKKKMKMEEVPHAPPAMDHVEIADPHKKKKKKKKQVTFIDAPPTLDSSCDVEDGVPGIGAKVTCKVSDPTEKPVAGEETENVMEPHNWKANKLRPSLVYGEFTAQDDAVLKQAIFDYIREKGWEREDGIQKVLHSRSTEARGCWPTIGKCLPQRELRSLYDRAHRLLGTDTRLGRWTSAEIDALKELHQVHGNQWAKISKVIGRDPTSCCIKWNRLKWCNSLDQKTGRWSQEERQKLCTLVLECLREKRHMAKKGKLTKDHRGVRDNINWVYIAEQMEGRNRYQCSHQWYRHDRLAQSMETSVELSNADD
ncbi:hypothetical protein KC19_1G278100 [Ceratodon purpureus]|uniref:Uncharacterized protein n=1 Tax=Ceratodon purpureus TaxID=3225 RepID=A0A8T0JCY5_CERPU|nr:hypothetical protein KC19_1G278100 [Ceratodon purpureus]